MKYFNHLCDSGDDPDIQDAINEFGHHGYYVFFRTLEILGRELDPSKPGYICISFEVFRKKFSKVSEKILKRILKHFQNSRRIFTKTFEKNSKTFIHVNCPKFRKLLNESTMRKVREYRKKTGSKTVKKRLKDKDEDKDKDKDKRKEPPKPPKGGVEHPVEKINDKRLNVDALKDFYNWRQGERKPKAPMGPKAVNLAYKFLIKYPHSIQRQIVDKSIMNNWQGLFEPDNRSGKKESLPEGYFDPYDTPYFKKMNEKYDKITDTSEKVEVVLSDDPDDYVIQGADEVDWDGLTPQEKKAKWQELRSKAIHKQ